MQIRKKSLKIIAFVFIFIAVVAVIFVRNIPKTNAGDSGNSVSGNAALGNAGSGSNNGIQNSLSPDSGSSDGYVAIPLSEISKNLKKYTYNAGGVEVRYLVVLGSDGKVRTAFDACDVCGGAKGYRQNGNIVACNTCGKTFKIDDLGTKNTPGGCWPSFLANKIEGNNILVSKKELQAGAFRFA